MSDAPRFQPVGRWVLAVDDDIETTLYVEMDAQGGMSGLLESGADEAPEPFSGRYSWDSGRGALGLSFDFEGEPPESFEVIFEGRTPDGFVATDDEGTAYVFMPAI